MSIRHSFSENSAFSVVNLRYDKVNVSIHRNIFIGRNPMPLCVLGSHVRMKRFGGEKGKCAAKEGGNLESKKF